MRVIFAWSFRKPKGETLPIRKPVTARHPLIVDILEREKESRDGFPRP
jgi:hypothetical protein